MPRAPSAPIVALLPLAAVMALELPLPAGSAAMAGLAALWLLSEERRLGTSGLAAASLLLLLAWSARAHGWGAVPSPLSLQRACGGLWENLGHAAEEAAERIGAAPRESLERLQAFASLQGLAGERRLARHALLLLDPNGEAVAWAGDGLLHEPTSGRIPASGFMGLQGATAGTLLAVAPLPGANRWRVVAGRSLTSTQLPCGGAYRFLSPGFRWRFAPGTGGAAPVGAVSLAFPEAPTLHVEVTRPGRLEVLGRRLAAALLAATFLGLVVLAALGLWAQGEAVRRSWIDGGRIALAAGAGGWAASQAAALAGHVGAALAVGSALATMGLLRPPARRTGRVTVLLAGLSGLGLMAGCQVLLAASGSRSLGTDLGGLEAFALRLAVLAASVGLLGLVASGAPREARPISAGWAIGFSLAAGALHDHRLVGTTLAVVGTASAALWLGRARRRQGSTLGLWLLVAAILGASFWEASFRARLRSELGTEYLPLLGPPVLGELVAFEEQLAGHFDGADIDALLPDFDPRADRQDLAYAMWRRSPLPERDGLTALVVLPRQGGASSFSFGLPLDEELQLVHDATRWPIPPERSWRQGLIAGEGVVRRAGQPWATVRYWLVPRPGFRLEVSEIEELELALLRGRPRLEGGTDGLPGEALYALYDRDGLALSSPFEGAPPAPPRVRRAGHGLARTEAGPVWYWSRQAEDGLEVIYLPLLSPLAGLERAATHAFGAAMLVAALALAVVLGAWPSGRPRRALETVIRSYSKRLVVVYTALLLLPLVALNLALFSSFEERQRNEQLSRGREALGSASLYLVDLLLNLPPGFGIQTAIDRQLLDWLSELAHHQVNLYWGSEVYSSSQQELFTAGLLPRRIPGDIYSRLALLGYESGVRTQHSGGVTYLELYAPLTIPGDPSVADRLFLSVPLLEQQSEVREQLAALRRQAVLITAGLFLVALAVGRRLARRFTDPIDELVEGTRRIASGASSLGVEPREIELSALARAIDDMAGRIGEGRRRLLAEKQLVERVVENVTSAIVSIDSAGRVLWRNRVAAELLALAEGTDLKAEIASREELSPLAAFIEEVAAIDTTVQRTVRLEGDGQREWSLSWVPLPGVHEPEALLVVEDATEVLQGQRLLAWAEMARIIAHEIKNPLTPIRLSVEHLREVYRAGQDSFPEVLERCTRNILKEVEELREIASEFSTYSRIPRAELREGDLLTPLRNLTESYQAGPRRGTEVVFEGPDLPLRARFDEKLLARALRNLLENAMRASSGSGKVEVRVAAVGAQALVQVTDCGPGVGPEALGRIFEPYFSTHDSGTGLGLPIARRIAEEHGGTIVARNAPGGGLEVTLTIPLVGDGA